MVKFASIETSVKLDTRQKNLKKIEGFVVGSNEKWNWLDEPHLAPALRSSESRVLFLAQFHLQVAAPTQNPACKRREGFTLVE